MLLIERLPVCVLAFVVAVVCTTADVAATESTDIDSFDEKLKLLEEKFEQKIKSLEEELARVKVIATNVTYVGFYAHRSSGDDVGAWGRIVYDTVTTEVGGAYDSSSGIFTCPVNGYYYFSVSTFSDNDHNMAQLVVNDEFYYGGAFADYRNWDQGSMSFLLYCTQGSQVYVRNARDGGNRYHQSPDGILGNGFMGFLVQKT